MDNLTHSLVGAVLGQMGLKKKTGLAMPTLIIAANLPDIDAGCAIYGIESLSMRRGITHGPIALLLLPILLWALMLGFDRWQERRGKRPPGRLPVHRGWLLALAYIGCLSHPLFDWMNSYGIRLLEPFSHRWFYGDALFIVDPWLLALLIAGVWLAWRRDRSGREDWRRPAWTAFGGVAAYLLANLGISAQAAAEARAAVPEATMIVANPTPLTFWRREVLVRTARHYASYAAVPFRALEPVQPPRAIGMDDPRIAPRVARNDEARAFLFWSRMPVAEARGDTIVLGDQRFEGMTGGRFAVELAP